VISDNLLVYFPKYTVAASYLREKDIVLGGGGYLVHLGDVSLERAMKKK